MRLETKGSKLFFMCSPEEFNQIQEAIPNLYHVALRELLEQGFDNLLISNPGNKFFAVLEKSTTEEK